MEFNMFSSEEVKKLSVARIDSLISFTPLGEPVPGGLYDARLGSIHTNSGKCSTCNQNAVLCSGHFGHIELPCPVINPIFTAAVIHILKISCLSCYKVLLPRETTILLAAQLKFLDNGQLTDAQDLATEINGLSEDDDRNLSVEELETFISLYLKERLQENDGSYVKSADEIRQAFIAETMNQVSKFIFKWFEFHKNTALMINLFLIIFHFFYRLLDEPDVCIVNNHFHLFLNHFQQLLFLMQLNQKKIKKLKNICSQQI